jgi:hypothetical protein
LSVSETGPTVFGVSYGSPEPAAVPQPELIRFRPETGTVGLDLVPGIGTGVGVYRHAASTADANVLLAYWEQSDADPPTNRLVRWTPTTGLAKFEPPIPVSRFLRVLLSEDGAVIVIEGLVNGSPGAFRYTEALGFESIAPIAGYDAIQPRYLSRDGRTLIGFASASETCQDDCPTGTILFRLTDGQAERLGPPEGLQCTPSNVGDTSRGPVVVMVCDGALHAYEQASGWQRLTGMPLNAASAHGMSPDGSSLFGSTADAPGNQAWRWRWSDELTILHTAPNLFLDAVNADGTVVAGRLSKDGVWDGFLWVDGAGVTPLPRMVPSSMNAAGDRIVGPDDKTASPGVPPALIARDGTRVPLDRALSAAGADPGDAELTSANITPSGELLYGDANLPNVGLRTWVARFPR